MIRKRPEKDTANPPGQWRNTLPSPAKEYKPVHGGYPGEWSKESKRIWDLPADTEEMFTPSGRSGE